MMMKSGGQSLPSSGHSTPKRSYSMSMPSSPSKGLSPAMDLTRPMSRIVRRRSLVSSPVALGSRWAHIMSWMVAVVDKVFILTPAAVHLILQWIPSCGKHCGWREQRNYDIKLKEHWQHVWLVPSLSNSWEQKVTMLWWIPHNIVSHRSHCCKKKTAIQTVLPYRHNCHTTCHISAACLLTEWSWIWQKGDIREAGETWRGKATVWCIMNTNRSRHAELKFTVFKLWACVRGGGEGAVRTLYVCHALPCTSLYALAPCLLLWMCCPSLVACHSTSYWWLCFVSCAGYIRFCLSWKEQVWYRHRLVCCTWLNIKY